jgi:YgiT-type zinc finger domain-containing protein
MELKKCPLCGSNDLVKVTGAFTVPMKKKSILIPRVSRQKCVECGEEFFNHESNRELDRYRKPNIRHAKAAA